jgi:hypothetical protein
VADTPTIYDIEILQGATWRLDILWKDEAGNPIDTSGYSARMQIRRSFEDETPEIELTDANGRITLGIVEDPPGTPVRNIRLEIEAAATEALAATPSDRRWRYDLEMVTGSEVRRLLQGRAKISLEVTR